MTVRLTAFKWVPPFAQGFVRDLRLRWALEEAGLPYEVELVDGAALATEAHRRWQPFGQVPAYRDEAVEMFESGAIVLHIAGKSEALAPLDEAGRRRVTTWVVAALNSIEPFVQDLVNLDTFHAGEAWTVERRPQAQANLDRRLVGLRDWLGDKPYLESRFTAGDIIMACVLRELAETDTFDRFPTLGAYVRRCEARPAFQRALDAQLRTFREHEPA